MQNLRFMKLPLGQSRKLLDTNEFYSLSGLENLSKLLNVPLSSQTSLKHFPLDTTCQRLASDCYSRASHSFVLACLILFIAWKIYAHPKPTHVRAFVFRPAFPSNSTFFCVKRAANDRGGKICEFLIKFPSLSQSRSSRKTMQIKIDF